MAPVHYLHEDIAIIGWSCRLPGANSVSDLWSLLVEGRCTITQVPADRFSLARYGHPRRNERGKSYSFAAGVLDDVWGFDPGVFGISPREATQMDPQQRIMLQLTWEALENASIRPSTIAGTEVGVFVGASQNDYAHALYGDQAIADGHFATGNALGILANRVSYIFDLHGPSITFDTACSSSLVALHQATEALRSGRIETAIVGGINVIASAAEFISFSQAGMLSPTGRCRAFSADADGYVRAEGGAALVLRRGVPSGCAVHGIVLASDVNSDGRTNGIALPSAKAQEELLNRVYSRAGIDPERLSFIEAHGTGTPVGDPVEANAIGRSLGRARGIALPIGSIKTNIGHLEAASGLAGLIKALLALNHGILPRTLHIREPNPNIDFAQLNLALCQEPLLLSHSAQNCAGVNSFGFGGTNAHVVIAPGRKAAQAPSRSQFRSGDFFALSAACQPALRALARTYHERLAHLSNQETASTATAIAHQRDWQPHRLVVSGTRQREVSEALAAFLDGASHPQLDCGTAIGKELPVAFVYSGNGTQWAGMGIAAYRQSARFRAHFHTVDEHFQRLAGWSLKEALFNERLGDRLSRTHVAQPLIFGIQSAVTAALTARGVRPAAVLGHSVGEVAAAEAAGILDLRSAVEVIHFRSAHQERLRGLGRMAAVLAAPETVEALVEDIANLEIAARNSPRATTVAGATDAVAEFKRTAEDRGLAVLDLELEYPFHTAFMAPIQAPLIADLRHITPHRGLVPFVSTVAGSCLPGSRLAAEYWWLNIREPVQFLDGIREVAKLGARFFVEIGPRGILHKHIADSLTGEIDHFVAVSLLDRNDADHDPTSKVVAKALISGAQLDIATVFGTDPGAAISLPRYPWQQQQFRFVPTAEAVELIESERRPFSGARYSRDALEWYAHIDTALFPALADHKVGDHVLFPATGFLEISLAVARAWLQSEDVKLANFEILKPLDLTNRETREIMSRVSPSSNTLEIFSRPRLSQVGWSLHCRSKILHGDARAFARAPSVPQHSAQRRFGHDALYRIADDSGLHYGPAFRLLDDAVMLDDAFIRVELASRSTKTDFVLDPICLDACCHGTLILFVELGAPERGVSYLPTRIDEVALLVPGGVPHSAIIEVLDKNERAIVANYYFFGPDRQLVAMLRGVRWQAAQVRRVGVLEANAFVELPQLVDGSILGARGLAVPAEAIVGYARRRGLLPKQPASSEADLLIEGCATAIAYEIALALADRGCIDVEALIGTGRLSINMRGWISRLLTSLEAAGLANLQSGQWQIIGDSLMPSAATVVQELRMKHPDRAAELLLMGALTGLTEDITASHAVTAAVGSILSATVLDFYDAASVSLRESSNVVECLLDDEALWPQDRALRVLQIGFDALTETLLRKRGNICLTVFEPDRRRFDRAQRALSKRQGIVLAGADDIASCGSFDIVLTAQSLHRLPDGIGLAGLREFLAPDAVLLAVEPLPSLFRDLSFGLDHSWWITDAAGRSAGRLKPTDAWVQSLQHAGFADARSHILGRGRGLMSLIVAKAPRMASAGTSPAASQLTLIVEPKAHSAGDLSSLVEGLLRERGILLAAMSAPDLAKTAAAGLVYFLVGDAPSGDAAEELAARCLQLKACAERLGRSPATLWLVFRGALVSDGAKVNPLATGLWAFSRTLANEFPNLDVRRIDIAAQVPDQAAAARLCDIIVSGTAETELQIDDTAIRANRIDTVTQALKRAPPLGIEAVQLQRSLLPGQRFRWQPMTRKAPGAFEVEIAIAATGLNFRDLMLILGLLPDDIVEHDAAGPTLGCECAGEVTRVGSSINHLQVGDHVIGFAAPAFSTHVTVAADQVAKLPAGMSYQAGATIPVAFLTAHYALITQAKLMPGEWVLVHGGAGGVGMAAIQIALARKARVIATAGSKAKRALLKILGVHHTVDSRSTNLVEEVRAITGNGVDVVLNNLAGEAMERNIACLREFGRFVELGKRDYVNNTCIGLRPFRNNISYFGVDLGQLMLGKTSIVQKIYKQLMRQLDSGVLSPLPYSEFDAADLAEAFYLMQHSGHIGKIVVRPPSADLVQYAQAPFAVSATGTHVITGGLGGFGLEAARWLAKRGARHVVLSGRHGAATDEARAGVADLVARGVEVCVEPCDITDHRAVAKLWKQIMVTMPPVVGILHAAMVLDDGVLAKLDAKRFHRVLAPKVKGLENLEAVTRGTKLDYFVLFSSVTTLSGSPGQANYVAANAYMEGVARRRRQEGLSGLAIGWGPIADVGVLARSEMLRSKLQKPTAIRGMRAAEALDLMAQALELPSSPELAVITISPTEGVFKADRLQVLKSPTYSNVVHNREADSEAAADHLDLPTVAKTEGIDAVRRTVIGIIVGHLARVLHTREEDISRARPLGEIGLDSLMALELAMNLEASFGGRAALTSSIDSLTVAGLANEIICQLDLEQKHEASVVKSVIERHFEKVEPRQLAVLEELAEDVTIKRRGVLS